MTWKPSYVLLQDLKDYVRVGDGVDDVQLQVAIDAASRAVDRYCGRQFGKLSAAAARYYTAVWDPCRCRWVIRIDDLMSTTDLAIAYDSDDDETYADAIDEYRLAPVNAAADSVPWTEIVVHPDSTNQPGSGENRTRVTAIWGWTGYPPPVVQATLLQASRWLARRNSPYGIAGSPDMGSELRLLNKLDPDVAVLLGTVRRWWAAA